MFTEFQKNYIERYGVPRNSEIKWISWILIMIALLTTVGLFIMSYSNKSIPGQVQNLINFGIIIYVIQNIIIIFMIVIISITLGIANSALNRIENSTIEDDAKLLIEARRMKMMREGLSFLHPKSRKMTYHVFNLLFKVTLLTLLVINGYQFSATVVLISILTSACFTFVQRRKIINHVKTLTEKNVFEMEQFLSNYEVAERREIIIEANLNKGNI